MATAPERGVQVAAIAIGNHSRDHVLGHRRDVGERPFAYASIPAMQAGCALLGATWRVRSLRTGQDATSLGGQHRNLRSFRLAALPQPNAALSPP